MKENFWNQMMNQIREDFYNDAKLDEYRLWFGGIDYVSIKGTTITLSVPSMFFKNQIIKRGYVDIIQKKINEALHKEMLLDFNVRKELLPNQFEKSSGGLDGRR